MIIVFTFFCTAVRSTRSTRPTTCASTAATSRASGPGPPPRSTSTGCSTSHAARLAVPGSRRDRAEPLHPLRRLLAGVRRRPRRRIGADRRRCRARHDAPDGVADDDAQLRGLPPLGRGRAEPTSGRRPGARVNLLVLGPQGSGKGTQAKRIAADHGIPHVATGDMFRAAVEQSTELGKRVEPILASGELVPDDLTIALIRERLSAPDAANGFVLDSFPDARPGGGARRDARGDRARPRRDPLLRPLRRDCDRADPPARRRGGPRGRHRRGDREAPGDYHEQTEPIVERYRATGKLVPLHQPVDPARWPPRSARRSSCSARAAA